MKCTEWTALTKLKDVGHQKYKCSFHMCTIAPRFPNFRPFCSTISRFWAIPHFRFSHWLPMLKFQSATKFFKLGRLPRKVIACVLYHGSQCPHKVWLTWDETVGEVFWNFQPNMVLCWEIFQSAIELLIFGGDHQKKYK